MRFGSIENLYPPDPEPEPIATCIACSCEIYEDDIFHKDPEGVPICNDKRCIEWNREIDLKMCPVGEEIRVNVYYDELIKQLR